MGIAQHPHRPRMARRRMIMIQRQYLSALVFMFVSLALSVASAEAKEVRISHLLKPESITWASCDSPALRTSPETAENIGYIGNTHSRFFIHFDSIVDVNSDSAHIYGRTKVRSNTCRIEGAVTVKFLTKLPYDSQYQAQPFKVTMHLDAIEEECNVAGSITGLITSFYYAFGNGTATLAGSGGIESCDDGNSSNQFIGHWKSQGTGKMKKLRWGWRRIPESDGLDCGAIAFIPCPSIKDPEWQNYSTDWHCQIEEIRSEECQEARKREEWWKR